MRSKNESIVKRVLKFTRLLAYFFAPHSYTRVRAHKSLVLRARGIKRCNSFLDSATVPRSERSRSFWTPLSAFAENRITRFAFAARRRQEMSIQSFTGNGHFPEPLRRLGRPPRRLARSPRNLILSQMRILKTNDRNVFLFRWTARGAGSYTW